MKFRDAVKLHNEDEVMVTPRRSTPGPILRVVSTSIDREAKAVSVLCDNGEVYHHTQLQ